MGVNMNLNQLRLFYAAAKHSNLRVAANELFISQPAVTRGIQRLQNHYEIKLFRRFGRKLELTYAGAGLYKIAEKIFDMEGIAESYLLEFEKSNRGCLRIDASETFGTQYLPSILNLFISKYPKVKITVKILSNPVVIKRTVERNNDLGFTSSPIDNRKLNSFKVFHENLIFILPPDHNLAKKDFLQPEDLNNQSIVMHENGSEQQKFLKKLIEKNNISINSYLDFSNNEAVKNAVQLGTGIALISSKVVKEEMASGKLKGIPFYGDSMKRDFFMVYSIDKIISKQLQRMIDTVNIWTGDFSYK